MSNEAKIECRGVKPFDVVKVILPSGKTGTAWVSQVLKYSVRLVPIGVYRSEVGGPVPREAFHQEWHTDVVVGLAHRYLAPGEPFKIKAWSGLR